MAALLAWPALWNGYPLLFADSGTYLSQAAVPYLGWDRPPFYSLFLLPLHLQLSPWPVVAAQALFAAWILRSLCLALWPDGGAGRPVALAAVLSAGTSLPFLACTVMPDLATGLLVIALVLILRGAGWVTVAAAAAMAAMHLSHLPLAAGLLALLLPLARPARGAALRALAVPALGAAAILGANLAGHGRAALAPMADAFLLARLVEDGPAADVLRRDCPASGWHLCATVARLPMTADDFLWRDDSPLHAKGDPRALLPEISAILARTDDASLLRGALADAARQMTMIATGDGLRPWPRSVTPWIDRLFPAREAAAYRDAAQTRGDLALPAGLLALHALLAWTALGACIAVAAARTGARRLFAVAALAALPLNAALTGALSGPHDRYQSRIAWLPVAVVASLAPARALRRPRAAQASPWATA
jgi:hypothetical protein